MKLPVDINLSPHWVDVLADAGVEAAHWSTLGTYNAPDSEIMAYASANNCVVLTHDLDFGAILAATHGETPSVVQITDCYCLAANGLRAGRRRATHGRLEPHALALAAVAITCLPSPSRAPKPNQT